MMFILSGALFAQTGSQPSDEKQDSLPDLSIYHVSYLGSLTNSGKKTISIVNGDVLEKGIALSYSGVVGIEKNIYRGIFGFAEYGFSQKLVDITYGGNTDGNYYFQGGARQIVGMRVENNFRITAGLSYAVRMRKYLILQGGVGYINVNQLTYAESRATPPLTVTAGCCGNAFIAYDSKTDVSRIDTSFHGFALMANFIITPFESVHFPLSIRYNTIFIPHIFSENTYLPSSVQELWVGTGVRLVI